MKEKFNKLGFNKIKSLFIKSYLKEIDYRIGKDFCNIYNW